MSHSLSHIIEEAKSLGFVLIPEIDVLRSQAAHLGYELILECDLTNRIQEAYDAGGDAAFAEGFEAGVNSSLDKINRLASWEVSTTGRASKIRSRWITDDLDAGTGPAYWRRGYYFIASDVLESLRHTREQIPYRDLYEPGEVPGGRITPLPVEEIEEDIESLKIVGGNLESVKGKDDVFCIRVELPRTDGKRCRYTETFYGLKKDAYKRMIEIRDCVKSNKPIDERRRYI